MTVLFSQSEESLSNQKAGRRPIVDKPFCDWHQKISSIFRSHEGTCERTRGGTSQRELPEPEMNKSDKPFFTVSHMQGVEEKSPDKRPNSAHSWNNL